MAVGIGKSPCHSWEEAELGTNFIIEQGSLVPHSTSSPHFLLHNNFPLFFLGKLKHSSMAEKSRRNGREIKGLGDCMGFLPQLCNCQGALAKSQQKNRRGGDGNPQLSKLCQDRAHACPVPVPLSNATVMGAHFCQNLETSSRVIFLDQLKNYPSHQEKKSIGVGIIFLLLGLL